MNTPLSNVWEVTPKYFIRSGAQDDYVLWVAAPTRDTVVRLLQGLPFKVSEGDVSDATRRNADFSLPLHEHMFRAKCKLMSVQGPDTPEYLLADLVKNPEKLQSGQMYLRLFHGRDDPEENMDGWGYDGPVFGPLKFAQVTYMTNIGIASIDGRETGPMLSTTDPMFFKGDLLQYDGKYYGDWSVFVA